MAKQIIILSICLIGFNKLHAQSGMVEKSGGGTTFSAEQYKIDRMKQQQNNSGSTNKPAPKEYYFTSKAKTDDGIWIDGFQRYRHPKNNRCRYNEGVSEIEFCKAVYPKDTSRYFDYFKGGGNIPWCRSTYDFDVAACERIVKKIGTITEEGIPFELFDSLQMSTCFDNSSTNGYKLGREYEFSKGVFWQIKRIAGPEKMNMEFRGEFVVAGGEDNVYVLINDKGQYTVTAQFHNWKTTSKEMGTGKSKAWIPGGWNEVGIIKDEFNNVKFFVNGIEEYQYATPDIPIASRYASSQLKMPRDAKKSGLKVSVKSIVIESYPLQN